MKFLIPENGKMVNFKKSIISLKAGEYETEDKELQEVLKKCRNVSEVKTSKK